MTILFVRHAHAGERPWAERDHARPLTDLGVAEAAALVALHAGRSIDRVLLSPYLRCVQTAEPLARNRGLELERSEVLAEGVDRHALEELLDELVGQNVVLCSHGDILDATLRLLVQRGADLGLARWGQKASTWILEDDGRTITRGRYLPPPPI